MANGGLISRMLHALDEFERGRASFDQVERFVEFHMQCLERIGSREIHQSRQLKRRLGEAHLWAGMEGFSNVEPVGVVLDDFRRFLCSLPDGCDAELSTSRDQGSVNPQVQTPDAKPESN